LEAGLLLCVPVLLVLLWEPLGAFPPPQPASARATAATAAAASSLRVAADSVRLID
jgi:uncharacterized membrane protein YfcA